MIRSQVYTEDYGWTKLCPRDLGSSSSLLLTTRKKGPDNGISAVTSRDLSRSAGFAVRRVSLHWCYKQCSTSSKIIFRTAMHREKKYCYLCTEYFPEGALRHAVSVERYFIGRIIIIFSIVIWDYCNACNISFRYKCEKTRFSRACIEPYFFRLFSRQCVKKVW